MSVDPASGPPVRSWVAAIHESEDDYQPLGCGVVVDTRRVLTCAHVVRLKTRSSNPCGSLFP